jgi:hypothetical protein
MPPSVIGIHAWITSRSKGNSSNPPMESPFVFIAITSFMIIPFFKLMLQTIVFKLTFSDFFKPEPQTILKVFFFSNQIFRRSPAIKKRNHKIPIFQGPRLTLDIGKSIIFVLI